LTAEDDRVIAEIATSHQEVTDVSYDEMHTRSPIDVSRSDAGKVITVFLLQPFCLPHPPWSNISRTDYVLSTKFQTALYKQETVPY